MGLVSGMVALVTGSAAGIGRAAALKFAEEGARVVVSDVNSDGGNDTVALVRQRGGDAVFVEADVTRVADVEALVARIADQYGRLDCACNNAGIEGRVIPNSPGGIGIGSTPRSASCAFTLASASAALVAALSFCTISAGGRSGRTSRSPRRLPRIRRAPAPRAGLLSASRW